MQSQIMTQQQWEAEEEKKIIHLGMDPLAYHKRKRFLAYQAAMLRKQTWSLKPHVVLLLKVSTALNSTPAAQDQGNGNSRTWVRMIKAIVVDFEKCEKCLCSDCGNPYCENPYCEYPEVPDYCYAKSVFTCPDWIKKESEE
jgi:hypothetical protein